MGGDALGDGIGRRSVRHDLGQQFLEEAAQMEDGYRTGLDDRNALLG